MLAQLSGHIVNQADRICVAHAAVDGLLRASVCTFVSAKLRF